jgi:hypothetical protein
MTDPIGSPSLKGDGTFRPASVAKHRSSRERSETGLDPVAPRLRSGPSAKRRGFVVLIANYEDLFGK